MKIATEVRSGLLILLFAGLAFGLESCDKMGTDADLAERTVEIRPAEVGILHNQALDHVFADLQAAAGAGNLTREDVYEIARASLSDFLAQAGLGEITDEYWALAFAAAQSGSASWGERKDGGAPTVSIRAIEYLDRIVELIDTPVPLQDFERSLAAIEQEAEGQLRDRDLAAVLSASSLALNSARYWNGGSAKWTALLCDEGLCQRPLTSASQASAANPDPSAARSQAMAINGWKVLGADLVGCAVGAFGGGLFGCAVGGAGASTIAIIMQS